MTSKVAGAEVVPVVVVHDGAATYLGVLRERFPEIPFVVCDSYRDLPRVLARHAPELVLAFKIGRAPFPRAALLESGVRWIHVGGAGVDHLLPWDAGRVQVTSSRGIHGDIMAQHVLCVVLMANLHFPTYRRQQEARLWRPYEAVTALGQTMGVVGFGSVGQAIGRLARGVGMRVIGIRSRPEPSEAADAVVGAQALRRVAGEVDHLVVCLPLTAATRGMIDASVLGAMRKTARLIDVSRGGIVDGQALIEALRSGRLAGAALDVFATEPLPEDSPFWGMDNVILTPHACSDIVGWQGRVAEVFARNLERWREGRPLCNLVDPARGY